MRAMIIYLFIYVLFLDSVYSIIGYMKHKKLFKLEERLGKN